MNLNPERWADVPGFEGRYSVSTLGRVRVDCGQKAGLILRDFQQAGKQYRRVNLYQADGKLLQRGVHQLVAAAFLGARPEGHVVNHIDANPENNRLENLEYVTHQGNIRHAARLGRLARRPGESNPNAKLRLDMVVDIKWLILCGFSNRQLAEMYHVSSATILAIRRGRIWQNVPVGPWSRELEEQSRATM